MKTIKKVILISVIIIVAGIIGLLSYVKFALPDVGAPENIKIAITPARIERGKYLVTSVCACIDCHSARNWHQYPAPIIAGTYGGGGEKFGHDEGFPGTFYARNITPFNLKNWTDGEIMRAITCGVDKNGKALFPVMPYLNYGRLDRNDIYSIIAYLRTLSPVNSNPPASNADFPMNFIINTIPQKSHFSTIPSKSDTVAYGKYLLTAASCNDCHTMQVKGKYVTGMTLAGGFKFPLITGGTVVSANITPDKKTGIGKWTEEDFVKRFKVYADSNFKPSEIKNGAFNTVMPWMLYAKMKVSDLEAIYAYLRTVRPVKHKVVHFIPE